MGTVEELVGENVMTEGTRGCCEVRASIFKTGFSERAGVFMLMASHWGISSGANTRSDWDCEQVRKRVCIGVNWWHWR